MGFSNYEIVVGYEDDILGTGSDPITEKSWTAFFTYFGYGVISGLFMFGFGEVIYLLNKIRETSEEHLNLLKEETKSRENEIA
ncbi:hypothetical protein KO561_05375 [Radiobacillus kanasensis]|uniref:hypothetical protein n=1 Tax=Radiobacillus kanasensis TaxID=2844358 RepID=UPI001E4FD51A|nr:hypothetical protein [Radiobacillus kanasensis]UFU00378.1 hypothetical protein KO561_05375 [Radiobacillus kanasensis]